MERSRLERSCSVRFSGFLRLPFSGNILFIQSQDALPENGLDQAGFKFVGYFLSQTDSNDAIGVRAGYRKVQKRNIREKPGGWSCFPVFQKRLPGGGTLLQGIGEGPWRPPDPCCP